MKNTVLSQGIGGRPGSHPVQQSGRVSRATSSSSNVHRVDDAELVDKTVLTAECFNVVVDGEPVPPGALETGGALSRAATRIKDTWSGAFRWITVPVPDDVKHGDTIYIYNGEKVLGTFQCPFYAIPGWKIPIKVRRENFDSFGRVQIRTSSVAEPSSSNIFVTIPDSAQPNKQFFVLLGMQVLPVACPPTASPGQTLLIKLPPSLLKKLPTLSVEKPMCFPFIPVANRVFHADDDTVVSRVRIPLEATPGQPFQAAFGSRMVQVEWPKNAQSGSYVSVRLRQEFSVQIPSGIQPGDSFPCRVDGALVVVKCAHGKRPGDFQLFYRTQRN